jgi:two-component system chemotaxis response regulator CheY
MPHSPDDAAGLLAAARPVLVVDDQPTMLKILRSRFEEIGLDDLTLVANPPEAVAALRRRTHGLIFSDVEMSPVNGFEFLQFVRAQPSLARIPFVLVTASLQFTHVSDARALNADGYLLKPFEAAALRRTVLDVMARRAPERTSEEEEEATRKAQVSHVRSQPRFAVRK